MIYESDKDIFNDLSEQSVIVNQCNTKGWIGTGIQTKIHNKYPQSYNDYREYCSWFKDGHEHEIIGTWARTKINDNLIIVNAITQVSTHKNKNLINFDAWRNVFRKMEHQTRYINKQYGTNWTIHISNKLCGINSINSQYLHELINEYFSESPVKVVIHKY